MIAVTRLCLSGKWRYIEGGVTPAAVATARMAGGVDVTQLRQQVGRDPDHDLAQLVPGAAPAASVGGGHGVIVFSGGSWTRTGTLPRRVSVATSAASGVPWAATRTCAQRR